jgi:hypothetical protein
LPAGQSVPLRLVQTDGDTLLDHTEVAATISRPDGAFSFVGVPSGRYAIRVERVPRPAQRITQVGAATRSELAPGASDEPTLWATVPVTVSGGDEREVSVGLSTGVRARGRLVFSGVAPKPTAAQLSLLEIAIDKASGQHPLIFNTDRVRPTADTFQTAELVPGKYLIRASAPPGWTLKSATAGDTDVAAPGGG